MAVISTDIGKEDNQTAHLVRQEKYGNMKYENMADDQV